MFRLYDFPAGENDFPLYDIKINGLKAKQHYCRVSAMPYNTVWPGHQRPKDQTEDASFVSFVTDGPADFEVGADIKSEDITVRPLSRNVTAEVKEGKIYFTVPGPGYYTLEIGGQHNALHIFADSPEVEKYVDDGNTATYKFEHGVFDAGEIILKSGESVYIAEDAVVCGAVSAENAENIRVFGCGILDNSKVERDSGSCRRLGVMRFTSCRNVMVEGITIRDSNCWTATVNISDNVSFDRVKLIGMWRYNSDGIDFVNSSNGSVTNSFLRNFDDGVVLKGLKWYDHRNVANMVTRGCVFWCDWGRPLEIGAETCADEYRNIIFEDCDIIHGDCILMDVQAGDRADIGNVVFKNIRCEYSKYQMWPVYQQDMNAPYKAPDEIFMPVLFNSNLYCGRWSQDMLLGNVHDVFAEDIFIYADPGLKVPTVRLVGKEKGHGNRNIRFRNVYFNGKKLSGEDIPTEKSEFDEVIYED